MSKRTASPCFGKRLERVRLRLGYTSIADFARKIGQNYTTYRQWERFDAAPSAEALKRATRSLNVKEWRQLFLWLCDGVDEPPVWLDGEGPVPVAGAEDKDDALPLLAPVRRTRRLPIPWRALEVLIQQGRAASDRRDLEEVTRIEDAVREVVWPVAPRRSETSETPGLPTPQGP